MLQLFVDKIYDMIFPLERVIRFMTNPRSFVILCHFSFSSSMNNPRSLRGSEVIDKI